MNRDERLARMQKCTAREVSRYQRRRTNGGFWRALGLIGSVGWPIVLLALGGAWLGRFCDARLGGGIRCTALLLFAGTGLGTYVALRSVRKEGR
jgi:hypothetical protein